MICTILIFFLLFNSILCQSVFDPATFTSASCPTNYYWTSWFDTNDPTFAQADMELTSHIQQLFGSYMCAYPIAIEAQTVFDTSPATTGDVFRISAQDGFLCLNQQVTVYKSKLCNDYKVRYCCPVTSG